MSSRSDREPAAHIGAPETSKSAGGRITIDLETGRVTMDRDGHRVTHPLGTPQALSIVAQAWLRCAWDAKYMYTFTWLGRPVIQLPDDLIRVQEMVHALQPDLIVETGVAHGGSLVFYASLCRLNGRGRVIGVDVDIRPPARDAMSSHPLAPYIALVEGDSADPATVERVRAQVRPGERVMVVLDSNHSRRHVLAELEAYCGIVSVGSYLVATDGYMAHLAASPRARPEWAWDNPAAAVQEFLTRHPEFRLDPPPWPFNESNGLTANVTYWADGWLKRTH